MVDFAELVESESRGLVAAATAIVGDRHRAEEIVQEAFERCFRRWSRVSQLDRPGAWTRRVAINEAISVARRSSSEHRAVQRLGEMAASSARSRIDPLAALDDDGVWAAVRRPQRRGRGRDAPDHRPGSEVAPLPGAGRTARRARHPVAREMKAGQP
jgi:DNA-directed RNA polymerase specialized sigma24 family protein